MAKIGRFGYLQFASGKSRGMFHLVFLVCIAQHQDGFLCFFACLLLVVCIMYFRGCGCDV